MTLHKETMNRAEYILHCLASGKKREQLAKEFGHKDYRSLDMYMRRSGYVWDSEMENYMIKESTIQFDAFKTDKVQSGKVMQVIELFKQGLDAKKVAEQMFFSSHYSLADYMKQKGYGWNQEKKNYVWEMGKVEDEDAIESKITSTASIVEQVPRYLIPGIVKNKNISMSHLLDQLMVEFSKVKNIKQREIVEVALVEFFQKYGYTHEVKALLQR